MTNGFTKIISDLRKVSTSHQLLMNTFIFIWIITLCQGVSVTTNYTHQIQITWLLITRHLSLYQCTPPEQSASWSTTLWGGWIFSAKEKCSLTQIWTDLWTIFERNKPFVYIEKVLDLWIQLLKNGGKNKCCVYNLVQHLYIYIYIYI